MAPASVVTEGLGEHADVVFPSEAYAEKEGTVTHPDGRVQRLRIAIGRTGGVRAEWRVLAELAERLGLADNPLTAAMASTRHPAGTPPVRPRAMGRRCTGPSGWVTVPSLSG